MITYWWCLICHERGEYTHTADGEMRGKGTPWKHSNDTGHSTMTSIHPRPAVDTEDVRFSD